MVVPREREEIMEQAKKQVIYVFSHLLTRDCPCWTLLGANFTAPKEGTHTKQLRVNHGEEKAKMASVTRKFLKEVIADIESAVNIEWSENHYYIDRYITKEDKIVYVWPPGAEFVLNLVMPTEGSDDE